MLTTTIRPKMLGKWKLSGKCIPESRGFNCGPGIQRLIRTCNDGTIAKCKAADQRSQRQCSLRNCPKKVGEWKDQSDCKTIDNMKKCGPGKILQTRTCKNGTVEICSIEDTRQTGNCFIKCRKLFGPWIKAQCIPQAPNQNCGRGTQRETRTCKPGTNDPCLDEETIRVNFCDLGACPKG